MLQTADNGFQPVIWVSKRIPGPAELALRPHLRPYCRRSGGLLSLERPMPLSPKHRLLADPRAFGQDTQFGERFLLAKLQAEVWPELHATGRDGQSGCLCAPHD
ncbi:hypothetical protein METH_16165 [Leisingera methylohalidivorans DSM 14336]|uniref:Hedgehog/Intein (Hint) domain-containing protein n=2 Tax=Leisingera methylohalidivorans TaxID=133924 RepID=V9VWP5_9RHOB|nr:hypothetical protein METH_16165 [Leisingera methylohalidivorans DSM 14336]